MYNRQDTVENDLLKGALRSRQYERGADDEVPGHVRTDYLPTSCFLGLQEYKRRSQTVGAAAEKKG